MLSHKKNVPAFVRYGIPYDVSWIDIEHTQGKRYLTWDETTFPDPRQLQDTLADTGRKTVVIVDPHIKADPQYHVYATGKVTRKGAGTHMVRDKTGNVFYGDCWSGELGEGGGWWCF